MSTSIALLLLLLPTAAASHPLCLSVSVCLSVFLWVVTSCLLMQSVLINPLAQSRNPFQINVVGLAMRYMNYNSSMKPK